MVKKKTEKPTKEKKTKKAASKTKKAASAKTKKKKSKDAPADTSFVVIEDDLEVNKDAELEARKAYLEEARSQEAFD